VSVMSITFSHAPNDCVITRTVKDRQDAAYRRKRFNGACAERRRVLHEKNLHTMSRPRPMAALRAGR
jgi:hypothetical protein